MVSAVHRVLFVIVQRYNPNITAAQKIYNKQVQRRRDNNAVRNNVQDVAKYYVLAGGRYQLPRLNSVH